MAWAAPTAIRPADAPRENIRSRRDGTWKECTTWMPTKSTVSGFSTVVMSVTGRALTWWKNQTRTAMAPSATSTLIHPGGRARVA